MAIHSMPRHGMRYACWPRWLLPLPFLALQLTDLIIRKMPSDRIRLHIRRCCARRNSAVRAEGGKNNQPYAGTASRLGAITPPGGRCCAAPPAPSAAHLGGQVERTPPVCRSALYSLFLPPFGSGSVTVFDHAPLCTSPSQKPACGFPAQASSDGH